MKGVSGASGRGGSDEGVIPNKCHNINLVHIVCMKRNALKSGFYGGSNFR